jgi:hypothetical protein
VVRASKRHSSPVPICSNRSRAAPQPSSQSPLEPRQPKVATVVVLPRQTTALRPICCSSADVGIHPTAGGTKEPYECETTDWMLHLCRRKSWAAVAARRYNLLEAIGSSDAVDSSDPTLFAFRVAVTLVDVQNCTTSFRQRNDKCNVVSRVCVWCVG